MHIASEHDSQQIISYKDFSGGLNITNAPEMIAPNELAVAVNVEPDTTTGLLKTVSGLAKICEGENLTDLIVDTVGNALLVVALENNVKKLYKVETGNEGTELSLVGTLSGLGNVCSASWEDGVLITAGGSLNYYHDGTLEVIANSFEDDTAYWDEVETDDWQTSTAYTVEQVRKYKDVLYECIKDHTSSAGETVTYNNANPLGVDAAYWMRATVKDWRHQMQYNVDDVVQSDGKLYICKKKHMSNDYTRTESNSFWTDSAYWTSFNAVDEEYDYIRAWEFDKYYKRNSVVSYGGSYFSCQTEHTSCKRTRTVENVFTDDSRYWIEYEMPEWEHGKAYNPGDMVLYDGVLYKCKATHISCAEAPDVQITGGLTETDSANWKQVDASEWDFNTIYTTGQLVYHNDKLYRCKTYHCSSGIAPTRANAVFIKDGRVWVAIDDEIHCSGVGDERNWAVNNNDISSAQWLQIGYKDGGTITGVCALAQDTVIFKDNHHAYRLSGEFPNWIVSEIGRRIDNMGFNSCVALQQNVFALGLENMQALSATDTYADMQAASVGTKVFSEFKEYGPQAKLRYVAPLNQIWVIDSKDRFLVFDAVNGGFYHRQYNGTVVDVAAVESAVFVLKTTGLYVVDDTDMVDDGEAMKWMIQGKSLVSNNDYLTKRVRIDTTLFFDHYVAHEYRIGKVVLNGSIPKSAQHIWHDFSELYHSKRPLVSEPIRNIYTNSEDVYDNPEEIYNSTTYIRSTDMYRVDKRVVDRNKVIKVSARGAGSLLFIDQINFEIVEV